MESHAVSVLDKPAAELTVVDVYEIAAVLGQEFERIIDRFGCDTLVGLVPRVVRVLELLEALVGRGSTGQEAEELRRELDRLRQERSDRHEQERKHQKELELLEDVWRGEVQDLLSQIAQLQAENKRLLVSLSLKESPVTEEDLQKHEGMSEKEKQVMKKLQDLVDKQRDEIRAKDRELTLRNEDVEALQLQQHRLIRMNQELLHRTGVMEAQGKTLIQQRAELEAAAQTHHQELGALRLEVTRLKKELRELELEREVAEIEELPLPNSEIPSPTPPLRTSSAAALSNSLKPNSVWVECGGDPDFMENCFECDKSLPFLPKSANREDNEEEGNEEETSTALLLNGSPDAEPEEEESDKPRFTLQELRDVLQEKNELKAQVFFLQEELAYYKSDELEENTSPIVSTPSPPPSLPPTDQRESGIRRLIFTAIMPMVAAGLITDDPTLLPIRRLSFV
ncbi:RILP-like protein 1 isoform X2 [Archocentrus centrarchus]|uniref:RILP-like protein 1 isoform X2 n=1 Tax=Archocentrus centrarchus TaxID=63155 RepID=UPI0011E9B88B|nr:RILP-like protein 1 isoform X2 [Archocentrus centrarchus]